jgi:hypothetical protein
MPAPNHKLRFIGAFAAFAVLALAISCKGFFQNPTLQTISLQPPTPFFAVGAQQPMQAWGTDSENNRYELTSNVAWELSNPSTGTVATIDPNTGTMTGVNAGTITVTASSEGISGTTTATVVETVSSMTISPSSTSVTDDGSQFASFKVTGQTISGTQDITPLVTLTAFLNGTAVGTGLPCTYDSATGKQDCTPAQGLVSVTTTYSIVVTYSGYTGTAQVAASLSVNPNP